MGRAKGIEGRINQRNLSRLVEQMRLNFLKRRGERNGMIREAER